MKGTRQYQYKPKFIQNSNENSSEGYHSREDGQIDIDKYVPRAEAKSTRTMREEVVRDGDEGSQDPSTRR